MGLWSAIKSVGRWIGQKLGLISDDVGRSRAVDENSNALSVEQMNELLRSYSTEYRQQAEKIENQCLDIVDKYFEYLLEKVQENHDIQQGIGIKKLRRTQRNISSKIRGAITKIVASRLSLDDAGCRKIIAMPPSDSKTFKMKNYCSDVLKDANNNLADKVAQALDDQSYEINDFLEDYMDDKERSVLNMKNEFSNLEKQMKEGNFDSEKAQLLPRLKLSILNDVYERISA